MCHVHDYTNPDISEHFFPVPKAFTEVRFHCTRKAHGDLGKETNRDVSVNGASSDSQKADVYVLLEEFSDIFSDLPGTTHLGEHKISVTTEEPVRSKLYPLPFALRQDLKQEIDSVLKWE